MKVLFAGGGTGGHLYPGVAMAAELKKRVPGISISFAGTSAGIEATEVPRLGYRLVLFPVRGLKRGLSIRALVENALILGDFAKSLSMAMALVRKEQPDVVVGTGGYVSAPLLLAAQLSGKKTLIQEQNAFPGVTTRLLARMATEVHLSFEESRKFFGGKSEVFVTGNPAREFPAESRESCLDFFGLDRSLPTLLVFGGSRGARAINNAVLKLCHRLEGTVNLIWQTGALDADRMRGEIGTSATRWIGPYIQEMGKAYGAADLVLCRAGASSLAELTNLGKPSVLIPYPYAAADHQRHNAMALVSAGASVMIDDSKIGEEASFDVILTLLRDREKLAQMGEAARREGHPGAAATLAERIIALSKS
ncbi:MAG TPA: undecaprenyldiphospho-muramoylpentapeptide beta-N- acetylglucosaminyltransferase [Chlorobaculum sp.]|uniref:UDP-N-acetylglucosamine--N-acetylmuramyl-(pentapeptide) pyrophosphoryl-undecaprenol N-acetylglucosamine transferase n=2 Tax=Chlorobaculum tepidum TaxID=1097 RepID=MURG_CHLTE|nr:undecaprenyldiphospho-muramoylpentapeptide beta-N-acetylglucosaminyltransferase [Chlorobaculum tepidum]Q8KGD4.1 RecName: Full=UDP-N-acetylglucosamine--N-acetylmuramyl-(pentapeptide) pyrophosphoryl-undecaprenol N-acetylglucosamine transferase; AltName: Full=Undecaprenyl-PP-MurNAc-pentapeptide-UDPGlcNAc GlcNAc transferase [Chlorobaculum tepidum TLS]AAM71282.1 UDP-N-acetylglucosamine--N-acetylmuramyl-(pentapeptide) pyrophosphoryl-undecaprenol N-acetylglucosamine transferase [Chlorobaculum tepidum